MHKPTLFIASVVIVLILSSCAGPVNTDTARAGAHQVLLPEGLPDIPPYDTGEFYSSYYDQPIFQLQPGQYNRLYPFIGDGVLSIMDEYHDLFGLCDAKGRIACEAVYGSVAILAQGNHRIYQLKRYYPGEYIENDGFSYFAGAIEYTYAALDGSWVHTFEDSVAGHPGMEIYGSVPLDILDFLPVKDSNGWGVMDYNGKMIYPCQEPYPVIFSDGLAAVWNHDATEYSYIDINGAVKLGPYAVSNAWDITDPYSFCLEQSVYFSHGLAQYRVNGKCGFINTSGEVVIKPQYDYVSVFDGEKILTHSADWSAYYFIDSNNTILDDSAAGHTLENGWYLEYLDEYNLLTKGTDSIRVADNMTIYGLPDDRFLCSWFDETDQKMWYKIIDQDNNEILAPTPGIAYPRDGFIRTYAEDSGDSYSCQLLGLLDCNGREILPAAFNQLLCFDNYFTVRQGDYGGLIDENGKWILKLLIHEGN